MKKFFIMALALALLCGGAARAEAAAMAIGSPAFSSGQIIPQKYTCLGSDISPAIAWKNIPPQTKSLALLVEDPDAPSGVWTHWVVYNLPPSSRGLPERRPPQEHLANGAWQGINSFGKTGYGGPCPPAGDPAHHYYFRLYALDKVFPPVRHVSGAVLKMSLKGHILATAALIGRYQRK